MRRTRLFLAAATWAAAAAPAGAATATGGAGSLVRAERDWMAAMVRRDASALRAFVDPGFTLSATIDLGRPPVAASAWLDNALHHLALGQFAFGAMKVERHGEIGLVRADYRWRGTFDGEAFDEGGTLVDIWRRRGGRWVVVARVITR